MAAANSNYFLRKPNSQAILNGQREQLELFLRSSTAFRPAFAWSSPWPGVLIAALSLLFLFRWLATPPPTEQGTQASPFLIVLALSTGLFGTLNALQSWRAVRWRRDALATGQFLDGIITQRRGETVIIHGSREMGTGQASEFFVINLDYELTTPQGQRMFASAEVVRDGLTAEQQLPTIGQRVCVFYLDNDRFELL